MAHFEDYYEILQVSPTAEVEVIDAAYRKLSQKYHPDKNKSPDATEKMTRINVAYDVLSNADTRMEFDKQWQQRKGTSTSAAGTSTAGKPKPVVKPKRIHFADMEPGKTKRTHFTIYNSGGRYQKIWFSNPDSWLKVVDWQSLSSADELPLKVKVEATGLGWGTTRKECIVVRLDDEETRVDVEIRSKTAPTYETSSSELDPPEPNPGNMAQPQSNPTLLADRAVWWGVLLLIPIFIIVSVLIIAVAMISGKNISSGEVVIALACALAVSLAIFFVGGTLILIYDLFAKRSGEYSQAFVWIISSIIFSLLAKSLVESVLRW